HVEVGHRNRAGDRVPGEGDAMQERRLARAERLHQLIRHHHPAERRVAGGHAFSEGDDVGLVAVPLGAEVVAEAAEGTDDLVGYQQHAVAIADVPDPLEAAGRRRGARTGGALARGKDPGGGGKQPPEFCTGSRNTAATDSGPSCSMARSISSAPPRPNAAGSVATNSGAR